MLSDKARNYGARLRTVVAAIGRALKRFDREEQAAVARQLVNLESELDQPGPGAWYPRLRRFVDRNSRSQPDVSGEINRVLGGLEHIAEYDMVYFGWAYFGPRQRLCRCLDSELRGRQVFEATTERSKRRPDSRQEDYSRVCTVHFRVQN